MAEALVAIRFVHFATAMAAFGIGAFRLYAFAGAATAADAPVRAGLDALLARTTTLAAIVLLISALAIVPCVAAEMTGSAAASFDPSTGDAVLFDTAFGQVGCWHVGFAAVLAVPRAVPRWQSCRWARFIVRFLSSRPWASRSLPLSRCSAPGRQRWAA